MNNQFIVVEPSNLKEIESPNGGEIVSSRIAFEVAAHFVL